MELVNNYELQIQELKIENDALKTLLQQRDGTHHQEYLKKHHECEMLKAKLQMVREFVHPDFRLTIMGKNL